MTVFDLTWILLKECLVFSSKAKPQTSIYRQLFLKKEKF